MTKVLNRTEAKPRLAGGQIIKALYATSINHEKKRSPKSEKGVRMLTITNDTSNRRAGLVTVTLLQDGTHFVLTGLGATPGTRIYTWGSFGHIYTLTDEESALLALLDEKDLYNVCADIFYGGWTLAESLAKAATAWEDKVPTPPLPAPLTIEVEGETASTVNEPVALPVHAELAALRQQVAMMWDELSKQNEKLNQRVDALTDNLDETILRIAGQDSVGGKIKISERAELYKLGCETMKRVSWHKNLRSVMKRAESDGALTAAQWRLVQDICDENPPAPTNGFKALT